MQRMGALSLALLRTDFLYYPPFLRFARGLASDVSQAEIAASDAEGAFSKVWKNKIASLSLLCQHAQRIERVWEARKLFVWKVA